MGVFMSNLLATLRRTLANEDGQGVIEYTLMVGLVVLVIWAAVFTFGIPAAISNMWGTVSSALTNPGVAPS